MALSQDPKAVARRKKRSAERRAAAIADRPRDSKGHLLPKQKPITFQDITAAGHDESYTPDPSEYPVQDTPDSLVGGGSGVSAQSQGQGPTTSGSPRSTRGTRGTNSKDYDLNGNSEDYDDNSEDYDFSPPGEQLSTPNPWPAVVYILVMLAFGVAVYFGLFA